MGYKVAVVGATGNVGHEILNVLAERKFPADTVKALASSESIGRQVSYGEDDILDVEDLDSYSFEGTDIAIFSTHSNIAKKYVPRAAKAGCFVIDNSSAFRMEPDVSLIVPEVNGDLLLQSRDANIVSNPNCVAIPLTLGLKPLKDEVGIKRVVASTYQSVSGAGRAAMDELFNQTRSVYVNDPLARTVFTKQIAFNVIPHIDTIDEATGHTGEEAKIIAETQKILEQPDLGVAVTAVRVPVFIGHAIAVNVELENAMSVGEARALLREAPGVSVIDMRADEGYVTPVEAAGEDTVYISRIRGDESVPYGLQFWVVADNLRKGAAVNAVQIAERFIAN
jgi:aspartate-semialdehyde dehydrogenase